MVFAINGLVEHTISHGTGLAHLRFYLLSQCALIDIELLLTEKWLRNHFVKHWQHLVGILAQHIDRDVGRIGVFRLLNYDAAIVKKLRHLLRTALHSAFGEQTVGSIGLERLRLEERACLERKHQTANVKGVGTEAKHHTAIVKTMLRRRKIAE